MKHIAFLLIIGCGGIAFLIPAALTGWSTSGIIIGVGACWIVMSLLNRIATAIFYGHPTAARKNDDDVDAHGVDPSDSMNSLSESSPAMDITDPVDYVIYFDD